jgi:hypothetical protein
MRISFRAPEADANASSRFTTPPKKEKLKMGGFDVGSPDFIDQRLDNLKRKPTLMTWLNDYVHRHPDSETEDEEEDEVCFVSLFTKGSSLSFKKLMTGCAVMIQDGETQASKNTETSRVGFLRSTLVSLGVLVLSPLLILLSPCLRNRPPG